MKKFPYRADEIQDEAIEVGKPAWQPSRTGVKLS